MSEDFAEFYAARKDAVLRAVLVATGDRVGGEDAAAEAFARACAGWDRVRQHPEPTAWVIRVALNVYRSWWRRLRREVLGLLPERTGELLGIAPATVHVHLHRALETLRVQAAAERPRRS